MPKMNLINHINIYEDENPSNNPSLNNVNWTNDECGLDISEPCSKSLKLQSGQSLSLFSGVVTISDDNTTTYDIAPKAGTSNTYVISHNGGTAPEFRASRSIGSDATTEITVTKNANILEFSSTGGTALDLVTANVQVGDSVRIGAGFNAVNQGLYTVIAFSATSFQVENASGQAEGPITLGASFADVLQIFSASGVQKSDKVKLISGFSILTLGTYEITDVNPDYIEIYSINALPTETNINTQLQIFNNSKQFLYIESDKELDITIDSVSIGSISPLSAGTKQKKAILLKTGEMTEATIQNNTSQEATIFYVTGE